MECKKYHGKIKNRKERAVQTYPIILPTSPPGYRLLRGPVEEILPVKNPTETKLLYSPSRRIIWVGSSPCGIHKPPTLGESFPSARPEPGPQQLSTLPTRPRPPRIRSPRWKKPSPLRRSSQSLRVKSKSSVPFGRSAATVWEARTSFNVKFNLAVRLRSTSRRDTHWRTCLHATTRSRDRSSVTGFPHDGAR